MEENSEIQLCGSQSDFTQIKQQKAFDEVLFQVARSVINAQSNLKFKVVVLAKKFVPFFLVCRIVPSAPIPFDKNCKLWCKSCVRGVVHRKE